MVKVKSIKLRFHVPVSCYVGGTSILFEPSNFESKKVSGGKDLDYWTTTRHSVKLVQVSAVDYQTKKGSISLHKLLKGITFFPQQLTVQNDLSVSEHKIITSEVEENAMIAVEELFVGRRDIGM